MTTYYVDQTGGNDGDTGLVGHAWKTISKINGFGFSAGDVCLLKRSEVGRAKRLNYMLRIANSNILRMEMD
jgi:hypothetical protein